MIATRFHTLIAQPATLCNLNCGYCYLPDRHRQRLMSVGVARRLAASIEEQDAAYPVEVVWHGGEPLTTPVGHMRALLAPFEELRVAGRVVHSVQANATLINLDWIGVFREFGFRVGVSIDGPGECNGGRVDWAGNPSYRNVMRGIQMLRYAAMPFMVICVVTAETIRGADELMEFFAGLDCDSVGFNIEEMEGLNAHRQQVTQARAQAFWRRLWQLQPDYPGLRVRDLERLRAFIAHSRAGELDGSGSEYEPIPTVSATGQTVVLSPELLGVQSAKYDNFIIGNVLVNSLPQLLATIAGVPYVKEFERGLRACAATCAFWDFCRGAQAGNRFFEHGAFDTTETAHCRNTYQAVALSALDHINA